MTRPARNPARNPDRDPDRNPDALQTLSGLRIAILPEGVPAPAGSVSVSLEPGAPMAFGLLGAGHEPVYVNPAFEGVFRQPVGVYFEGPGSFLQAIHPDDRALLLEALEKSDRGLAQCRLAGPAAEERWISFYCGPALLEDRGFRGVAWWASDITELKRRELDLARREEPYRAIWEQARDGFAVLDFELRALEVNDTMCEILGRPREQILGHSVQDYLPPGEQERYPSQVDRAVAGETVRREIPLLRGDGTLGWIEFTGNLLSDGRLLAITRDMTEHRQAELALRESEERYRQISEMTSDFAMSLRIHADGRIEREWLTDAFERMTGFRPEELDTTGGLIGLNSVEEARRSARHLVHADDHPGLEQRMTLFFRGPWTESHEEFRIVTRSGEVRWVFQRGKRVRVPREQGGGLRIFLVVQDITAQKAIADQRRRYAEHLEVEVRERTCELERLNDELRDLQSKMMRAERLGAAEQLAGSVAHSINNPLAALIGTVQMTLESSDAAEPTLERILKLAQRIRNVVARTLQMYREGDLDLQPEDPAAVMRDVADELTERALASGVRVTLESDERLGLVQVDRGMISAALVSLAENAIEAMPEGGDLRLQVRQLHALHVVEFRVIDSGRGLPAAAGDRIFEPFFTTKGTGAGLGLSIARGLIVGHEGRLRIERGPDGGTVAIAELPMRSSEELVAS